MEPLNSQPMEDSVLEETTEVFDREYFMNGKNSGKSNYENYSWLPHLTIPMVSNIKKHLGIQEGETVLEVGCSRGFMVKALRILNIKANGYDISNWAIENSDPEVREYLSTDLECSPMSYDYIISKDCAEHIELEELNKLIPRLYRGTRKSLFFIVPLTYEIGGKYVCPKDEMDSTHKIRWPLTEWVNFLQSFDRRMVVCGSYYIPGIKEANTAWENSCGFFTIRRF